MAKKEFGLGRGFSSLIPTDLVDEDFDATREEDKSVSKLKEIALEEIEPDKDQPRKTIDQENLQALADNIKKHGVLQPIVVVENEDKYMIVAGERRWRAAKLAGLKKIPAIVRTLDAQNRLELSIIENAQREDLSAIELATAYAKLKSQFNLSDAEIAERVGKSVASVRNTLRLLNLPEGAKQMMAKYKIGEGVMRPLVNADEEVIEEAVPKIVSEGWTARRVERFVSARKKKSSFVATKKEEFSRAEEKLEKKFGVDVVVSKRSIRFSCGGEEGVREMVKKLLK